MDKYLTVNNMEMYVVYECIKYTPIFARSGLYYVIRVRKVGESEEKTMVVTDGCIFNKINQLRIESSRSKFSFIKMEAHSINNNIITTLSIVGDHDSVILT